MDLSIATDGFTSQGNGGEGKSKLKPSGIFTQTITVTNNSHETATGDEGELSGLESKGIASLDTSYTDVIGFDAHGNIHGEHSSATLADGSTVDLVDVYFQIEA